jgi:glycosyltransferase involved in cell wall biosynthesis
LDEIADHFVKRVTLLQGVFGRINSMETTLEPLELTILMPCLNEAETIETCVKKAMGYIQSRGIRGEVVVADNGSTDGSQALAESCGARIVAIPTRGYGAALSGGIQAARGSYVIMGDADDSYDFTALDPFMEQLRAGYELVMGNRFMGGIEPNAMPPLHRYLGNPVLTAIGRVLFRSPSGDFHCGLRGFKRISILSLGLTSPGMEFASEMVVKATLGKLRLAEVPTTLSPDGRSRPPHLRSWRDGWRHLRFLLLFSPGWLFFYPGFLLLFLGAIVMALILPGQRAAGGITFDVNTLVFAAASVVCGFQDVVFYMFAKTHSIRSGLLPEDALVAKLRGMLRLEVGLIAGSILVALGLVLATYAVGYWGARSFGAINPEQSLRIVIPSATLLMLGIQVIFSSCLLSILQLETRTAGARTRKTDRPGESAVPAKDTAQ